MREESNMKDLEPKPIKIGSLLIGPVHSSHIVAEIGINHNGDMLLAKKQIDAAKESGETQHLDRRITVSG